MLLELIRFNRTHRETVGALFINGEIVAMTLEDPEQEEKIPGETCIPAGTYDIKLRTDSPMADRYVMKFGESHEGMLWLQDVPGFEWVYIHIGNTVKDTEGCILVATMYDVRNPGVIGASTAVYTSIHAKVQAAINRNEEVRITIHDS